MILIIALYSMVASSFTIGKILLDYVPPIFLIGIRMILAGICILSMQYFLNGVLRIKKQDVPLFLLTAFIHIFITYIFEFVSLTTIAPSCVALMFNLSPFFTAIFSYFLFQETITFKKAVGFAIGLVGVSYMVPESSDPACYRFMDPQYLILLTAVVSASLGWLLVRKLLYRGYGSMHINGFAMLVGGIGAMLCSRLLEPTAALPWGQMHQFVPLLVSIIFLANVVFYNMYGLLLKRYTATLLSFVGFLTPLFTAFYDWLWLGIQVELQFYVATVIVAYGIYIFYQEELRQGYVR